MPSELTKGFGAAIAALICGGLLLLGAGLADFACHSFSAPDDRTHKLGIVAGILGVALLAAGLGLPKWASRWARPSSENKEEND